jgi:hypothetical protein
MTKISEKKKPNWHSWKMMPLTWQTQKRRHWVVARPWVSFIYTQGKQTKQELWNLYILWVVDKEGLLTHSGSSVNMRSRSSRACRSKLSDTQKKVTSWSLLLLVNQTHHLHHEWQWLVAITPH